MTRKRRSSDNFANVHETISSSDERRFIFTATRFLRFVPDDLLEEVFKRLDARSAIRLSTVCKKLHSVISRKKLQVAQGPFSLLFVCPSFESNPHRLFYRLFVEKEEQMVASMTAMDWFPYSLSKFCIEATSNDLFVGKHFYNMEMREIWVCNILTKKRLLLSRPPCSPFNTTLGVACDVLHGKFKVVIVHSSSNVQDDLVMQSHVYCSEAKAWSEHTFVTPMPSAAPRLLKLYLGSSFERNGVIFFQLRYESELIGFVALEVFKIGIIPRVCRFVQLPSDFQGGSSSRDSKVCIGVVGGELRMSQIFTTKNDLGMKIWELRYSNGSRWDLVHYKIFSWDLKSDMFIIAFHPNYGDTVFVLLDSDCVYRLRIPADADAKLETVGTFSLPKEKCTGFYLDIIKHSLKSYTFQNHSWPTPL